MTIKRFSLMSALALSGALTLSGCGFLHTQDEPAIEPSSPVVQQTPSPSPPDRSANVSSNGGGTPNVKVQPGHGYSPARPTLMGVTLGTNREEAERLFGAPVHEFVMDEDPQDVTVYEYDGFTIGFNVFDRLEFVQVHSPQIDPGLGGVKLGHKRADCIKALGKPDNSTDYVLSYKSRDTVLKIDLDPVQDHVMSIKLFPSE